MNSLRGKSDDFLHLSVFICFSILIHAIAILTMDIDFTESIKKYSAVVLNVVLLTDSETKEQQKPAIEQEHALKKLPLQKRNSPFKKNQPDKFVQKPAPEKIRVQQKSSTKLEVQPPESDAVKDPPASGKISGADLIANSMAFVHSQAEKESAQKKYFYLPTTPSLIISSQPLFIEHPEPEPGVSIYLTSSGDTRYVYTSKSGKKRCFEYTTPDPLDQFPLAVFYVLSFGLNC
jgi:hypothetical protein